MSRSAIIAVLVGVLVPLVVKLWWDRSGSWLRKLLEIPADPDRETARLVTARLVTLEQTKHPGMWRFTVEVANASDKPVVDVSVGLDWPNENGGHQTTYSVGALRGEGSSTLTETVRLTDEEHMPPLVLMFSFGVENWVRRGEDLKPILSDGDWHRLRERQRRARRWRQGVAAIVGLPLIILILWLSYPLWATKPRPPGASGPPSQVQYVVTPTPFGSNPFGALANVKSNGITTTQAWRDGLLAPVFPKPPFKSTVTAVDARSPGDYAWISCILPESGPGGSLVQLAPNDQDPYEWMYLHDLSKTGSATPRRCKSQ